MEPSSAPDLPAPHPNDVNTEKLDYTEEYTTSIEFRYKWEIPDIRNITSRILQSPVFSPGINDQLKWSLMLYTSGTGSTSRDHRRTGQEYMSLYLCFEDCNKAEVTATFKMSILSHLGKQRTVEMNKPWKFTHGTKLATYGYNRFVSRMDIFDVHENLLVNQTLIILCEIKVHDIVTSSLETNRGIPFKIPHSQLFNDIERLFETKNYPDFTIVVDDQEFPVHRAILSARSCVFAAMFANDTEEPENNRVDITDMSPEVLTEMLRFIYTDKVVDIEKVAFVLLAAADKYALHRLKTLCEEALRKTLTIQDAAEILIHADLHNADQLKSEAIRFINTHAIAIMDTEGFRSMITSHPYLVAETLHASAMHEEVRKVRL